MTGCYLTHLFTEEVAQVPNIKYLATSIYLTRTLETWLEEVDAERRTIADDV